MIKNGAIVFLLIIFPFFSLMAQQTSCYVSVETTGSYDKLTVETISLTMLRQFVDSSIQPTPLSGFSEKDCMYRVNVVEKEEGIKVFLLGNKISDYGTSNLRGEPGLEQAILRAIYNGLDKQTTSICQKYGSMLENECQVTTPIQNNQQQIQTENQQLPPEQQGPDPRCQSKTGVTLPSFCNQSLQGGNQFGPPSRPPRPECQPKPGRKLPEYCKGPPDGRRPFGPPPRRRP